MRWICLLFVLVIACASAPQRDLALVRLVPVGPHICANDTLGGRPMRLMMLFVNLRYGVKEPVVVTFTNGEKLDLTTSALEFPAGLGWHKIVVMVGEKEYVRTFTVYQCGNGIKPARME